MIPEISGVSLVMFGSKTDILGIRICEEQREKKAERGVIHVTTQNVTKYFHLSIK